MEKDTIVLERIHNEIEKINKKESNIYFFVLDTKGNPSGSLAYIYNLALLLHNEGYKVSMLYQEQEEFVGVESWLGEKYASIPHYDISNGDVAVGASDILFIPEIYFNILVDAVLTLTPTSNLPSSLILINSQIILISSYFIFSL